MDKVDRRQRDRYGSAVPPHMRHHMQGSQPGHRNMRVDAHGQIIIDPEENLSDKEIYPAGNHINIPSIGKWVFLFNLLLLTPPAHSSTVNEPESIECPMKGSHYLNALMGGHYKQSFCTVSVLHML